MIDMENLAGKYVIRKYCLRSLRGCYMHSSGGPELKLLNDDDDDSFYNLHQTSVRY